MNYIIWNNKDSRDVEGLLICNLPPITKPQMRVKETVVDGMDGSIIEELGYESYDKTVAIGLKVGADVDKVIDFFTGNGEIVFSNEPNRYYRASIFKSIDFARLLRYKVANVTFRVQPFKYNCVEAVQEGNTKDESSMVIKNLGNHTSKPLITIRGSGTVELSVNGKFICDYTFPEGEDAVVLDGEKQDAYWGSALKNRNMTGEFPVFEKGDNVLSWSGTVESIQIQRYSRWL